MTTSIGRGFQLHTKMELYQAIKIAGLCILVASCETLNGIARTVYLNKRLGVTGTTILRSSQLLAAKYLVLREFVMRSHK